MGTPVLAGFVPSAGDGVLTEGRVRTKPASRPGLNLSETLVGIGARLRFGSLRLGVGLRLGELHRPHCADVLVAAVAGAPIPGSSGTVSPCLRRVGGAAAASLSGSRWTSPTLSI